MGPLPPLHRLLIAALLIAVGLGGGVWLASWLHLPLRGVGVGLAAGCLLTWLATHDFARRPERPVRIVRRR
ncbi:MAG TPA: hypothetical protein VD814_01470 [Nocardioides sp.]|nr:hypothetical protein [Nocardioides sp.]